MTKRILSLLLVFVLALSLCACDSIKDLFGGTSDDPGVQDVDPNAPAHEQLMTEVNNRLVWAAEQEDVGMTFQSEYLTALPRRRFPPCGYVSIPFSGLWAKEIISVRLSEMLPIKIGMPS